MTAAAARRAWHETIRRRVEADDDKPNLYQACERAYAVFQRMQQNEWDAEDARLLPFGVCVG